MDIIIQNNKIKNKQTINKIMKKILLKQSKQVVINQVKIILKIKLL